MRTRSVLLLALAALPLLAAAPAATPDQKVDLFGYYFFQGDTPPAGFQDIDHLHLSTIDEKDGKVVPAPLHGFIRMKPIGKALAVDHLLVDLKLQGKALSFGTKPTADGLSYQFAGSFLKLGNFPEDPPGDVVLKGHLIKLKGNKKTAEADVRFLYETGG